MCCGRSKGGRKIGTGTRTSIIDEQAKAAKLEDDKARRRKALKESKKK